MTLVARIAALSLLTSGLVAVLGLAVLSAFVDHRVPRGEYVIPGLILACVGGIIGAIAGTAREIVTARGAAQPQTTGLSTATKRRTPRVAAVLAVCFLCFVVVWFKARFSSNGEPTQLPPQPPAEPATNSASDESPRTIPQPTEKPGTASADSTKPAPVKSDAAADAKMPDISGIWAYETPELPLLIFDSKTKARFKADVPTTEKLLMRIRRATDSSADFTFENVELTRLPQDPTSQAEPAPAPQLERLKWSPESRKFGFLGADQKIASGITIELLDRDQFRLSRKVDEAERKRLIEEVGIPESAIEKLRNQVWKRVPVEVSDAATATNSARNGDPDNPKESAPDGSAKIPDAIQSLTPSIVTVTRVAPEEGDAATKPVSHAGVVVDSRGYIVIPLLPSPLLPKLFAIRFSDQEEVVGQLAAVDERLKFGVVKVERPRPVAAVSLAKSREARVDDRVLLVPSPRSKELRGGRVTSTTMVLGAEGSTKLIQSDVMFPLSEYGSLMVSEAGEVIGLLMASRGDPKPTSFALPVKAVLTLVQSAINKPKDVPVATVPASPPYTGLEQLQIGLLAGIFSFEPQAAPLDMLKPVQIGLQPATPLHKSLVELFGIKVLDYAEGKRLKIEALPHDLLALGNLLQLVAREYEKEAELFDASQTLKLGLQPPTPLVKSLVELFAKRGAKVLDYEAGKRLQIEAPPKAMEDLGKILEVVGREYQKNEGKSETSVAPTKVTAPASLKDEAAAPTVPKEVQALSSSIVTVTRVDPKTGLPSPNPNGRAGFVVDSRGYILTVLDDVKSNAESFKVRLADLQEFVAEVVASNARRNLMVLKIRSPQPLPAVSLAKICEPQNGDAVFVVPSPAAKGPSAGIVTATSRSLSDDDETKFIQTDIKLPLGEGGSLLVSALGEPIGIPIFIKAGKQPICFVRPLKTALSIIKAATNEEVAEEPVAAPPLPVTNGKMPDISGKWRIPVDDRAGREIVLSRVQSDSADFEYVGQVETVRVKWSADARKFDGTISTANPATVSTITLQPTLGQKSLSVAVTLSEQVKEQIRKSRPNDKPVDTLNQTWFRVEPRRDVAEAKTPDIVGTWNRAEAGTFSKLTIWQVANHESMFFVEGPDGSGLMETKQPFFTPINFRGLFTLNLLGDRTAEFGLQEGSKEAMQLFVWPAEDQRKQLLRSGFAKTEQELDQKLSAVWSRVDTPGPSKSKLTVSVFKTDVEPKRVRDALRAKYPEPDYRFFSNESKHSVIVLAPAEAQEEIEVALHKLDVKEDSSAGVSSANTSAVPAGMPDISGMWAYDPPDLPPEDVNRALIAPPQMFVVNRSKQDGIDFEFLGTREPTAAPTRLKWEPGTRRFRKVPLNDTGKEETTFELSTDGNQLNVRFLRVGVLDPKGGFAEAKATERYVTQEWRRVGSGKAAAPTPLKEPAPKPTVTDPNKDAPRDTDAVTVFGLRNASAEECAKQLNGLKFKARITVDGRTNSIFVSGDADEVKVIQAILQRLDAPSVNPVKQGEEAGASLPVPKNAADPKMPDITGTWGPYMRTKEVVIRRATSGDAEFEMTTRVLPQFKNSDPIADETSPRRIKWFPEAQHFQTLDPRPQSTATLTMKPSADGKSMHVTVTINGKPVDDKQFGKGSGEMEWQRTDSDEMSKLAAADAKMPDISGTWLKSKSGGFGNVEIRRANGDADFVIESKGVPPELDNASLAMTEVSRVRWSPEARQFEGPLKHEDDGSLRPSKITLQLLADGKTLRATLSLDEPTTEALKKKFPTDRERDEYLNREWHMNQEWTRKAPAAVAQAGPPNAAVSKMPDVSGKWFVYQRGHVVSKNGAEKRPSNPALRSTDGVHEFVIQRPADASADFVDKPGNSGASIWRIRWSERTQRFQWQWADDPTNNYDFMMMVLPDNKTARVRITQTKKAGSNDGERSEAEAEAVYFEEWSREKNLHRTDFGYLNGQVESQEILVKETFDGLAFFSKPLGKWSHLRIPRPEFNLLTSQIVVSQELAGIRTDDAVYGFSCRTGRIAKLPIPKELRDPSKNWPMLGPTSATVELGNEVYVITAQSGKWSSPNSPAPANNAELQPAPEPVAVRSSNALPDTPAAKRLVEQLGTQESAAAAEAATIRQLQANGQAEQNRQAIAEHQRKLKNLLSTAFDLKLQLEELQVQELQSRLSRLERQIGQRKELREKIINRRAGELIEGDALKWDASDTNSKKERPDQNVRTSQIRVIDSDGLNRGDGPRCSLSSPPEPIEVLREFERQRGIKQGAVTGIYEKNNQSIGVVVEFIYDRIDPPMDFPLIGKASLHRLRFRCTISFKDVDRTLWPTEGKLDRNGESTIHVDVDHLHRNDEAPAVGNTKRATKTATPEVVAILRARLDLLWDDLRNGNAKPSEGLRAINELAQAEPPEAHPQHVERLQALWELVRGASHLSKAEVLEIEAAYEAARSADDKHVKVKPGVASSSSTTTATPPKTDPLPSPEQLREQLEPFAKRASAAEERVRELETIYFRDRSNAAELQRAFEEMTTARSECRSQLRKYIPAAIKRLNLELASANALVGAQSAQHREKIKSLSEGNSTEAEVKAVSDSWKQAIEATAAIEAKLESYGNLAMQLTPFANQLEEIDDPLAFQDPPVAPQPGNHPDVSLAWLEAATDLKLEFIQFDDLKLPFKAALKIREPNNELGLKSGDLIVALYGQRFDSLDQAVIALKPSTRANDPGVQHRPNTVLRDGLAGRPVTMPFSYKFWPIDYLQPSDPYQAAVRLEIRVRRDGTETAETQYVSGTCVSPDGLVVIPVASQTLMAEEPFVAFGTIKGTAHIVASDDKRGLTLLKLSSPGNPLLSWVKCRSGKPTPNQQLRRFCHPTVSYASAGNPMAVSEVGQPYPKPFIGTDAFAALTSQTLVFELGDRLMSVENDLQGLILTSTPTPTEIASKKDENRRVLAIPAVHIQTLVDEYRRAASRPKPDPQARSQPPKVDALPKGDQTVEQLIAVLQDDRQGDRDPAQFVAALQRLRTIDLGDKAPRVASAILAAIAFHELLVKDPSKTGNSSPVPISYYVMDALKPLARSAKTPAFVAALRDGHRNAKLVTIWSLHNEPSLWEYAKEPDFAALAEQLLAVAAGPDELPRAACLSLLAKTLPLTKLDLAEITTDDRREALRKLGDAFPRERVRQLIIDSLSDTHIDVVLTAGQLVADMLNELPDLDVKARLVAAPTKILEGKFHDVTASTNQRGQALSLLRKLGDRSAPAVPVLIKLLKTSDVEFPAVPGTNPRVRRDAFSHENVILTLGAIGPAAKDALPFLEAELTKLEKKEKEDALLSGSTAPRGREAFGSTSTSALRTAIQKIKGEVEESTIHRS